MMKELITGITRGRVLKMRKGREREREGGSDVRKAGQKGIKAERKVKRGKELRIKAYLPHSVILTFPLIQRNHSKDRVKKELIFSRLSQKSNFLAYFCVM